MGRFVAVIWMVVCMTGVAQAQPAPPRNDQLNKDINEMLRDIQQRSREIEQRALNQQREEELYRRQQEERRQREEWLANQRGQGNTIIIDTPPQSSGGIVVVPPQSQQSSEPVWAEPIIPGWERSRIILRGQYWVQPAPRCQLETWMDGRGQPFRRWNCS